MKKIFILSLFLMTMVSCQNTPKNAEQSSEKSDLLEKFVAKESIDAGGYVYILGDQEGELKWFALTSREVAVGDVYYFAEPLVMKDFYSKELDRPFEEVTFLMKVSMDASELVEPAQDLSSGAPSGKVTTDKLDLSVDVPANGISVAELIENAKKYAGKKVIVRGEVVKFSPEIMNTNWVHLQDGTSFNEKYDLTITTTDKVAVGDVLTLEGIVTIDKDFGYGYFYELLLEQAVVVK